MALNNGNQTNPYSGRPAFNLRLYVWRSSVSQANNQSRWSWWLRAQNPGGSSQTFGLDSYPWAVSVAGQSWSGGHSLDFRGGQAYIQLASGVTGWVTHNAAGYLNVAWSASHNASTSVFGTASLSGTFASDRIPKAPGAVAAPTFQSATTTSISFGITSPSDNGGAPVTTYNLQALHPPFGASDIAAAWNSGSSNQVASPLPPGTEFRIRYRAVNSVGAGPWSPALTAFTLPSVPPGMTVTPALSGASASAVLTPPSGVSSVTSYRVERRPIGGSATVYNSPTSPITVGGLTPGAVNEWRASAFIGAYQTPWTEWAAVVQPRPNTTPGDYFDGSSEATDDAEHSWQGTANNSVSEETGVSPAGWRSFAEGAGASGGDGVAARVTGGRSGAFGARVTFFVDAEESGFIAGTAVVGAGLIEASGGGTYWASVYAWPSKPQRMRLVTEWFDALGDPIGLSVGPEVEVPGDGFTRLSGEVLAPSGTVSAAIGVQDVEGDGHSLWQGGDSLLLDDAMLSIGELLPWFSGDSAPTMQWDYEWLGEANESASRGVPNEAGDLDPLADPDCPPPPSPPRPPAIVDDCIIEVGTWRRYWAILPAQYIPQWLDVVPTFTLRSQALPERQVRIRVFANPDGLDPSDFTDDNWISEQIISYMPASTIITLDAVSRRVWASVDGGEEIPADRLLYGTAGRPASWPVLSCGISYLIAFDVPEDAPDGNLQVDVALTTRSL